MLAKGRDKYNDWLSFPVQCFTMERKIGCLAENARNNYSMNSWRMAFIS